MAGTSGGLPAKLPHIRRSTLRLSLKCGSISALFEWEMQALHSSLLLIRTNNCVFISFIILLIDNMTKEDSHNKDNNC